MKPLALCLIWVWVLTGCYNHKVDNFPKWCEQISGVDLEQKYRPVWAVLFSVSFDGEAIRDDFTSFLNALTLEAVQNRAPRMAWRQGTDLHLINVSSLNVVEPEKVIADWRRGIEAYKTGSNATPEQRCLYGTVASLFDSLVIHTWEADPLGMNWKEAPVTTIKTDRRARAEKVGLKPL
jgi:hypothetical protein